jgi:hypothetical protein
MCSCQVGRSTVPGESPAPKNLGVVCLEAVQYDVVIHSGIFARQQRALLSAAGKLD